jgi:osmoprotectant transport system ATP-binding protein
MVGPSGCGKTTILKMVNRLITPTSGRILLDGVDAETLPVHELRRGIGYVIQQVGLFPHRTVRDNIATVPALLGWDKKRTRARVDELCELVGLDPSVLRRYPSALSGGQQQRVGVARALAADPPVLLMDEPYSAVDPVVRARLQDDLIDLQRRLHKTILLVTHDIDEAIKVADRVALLDVGGVLEQYGPPDDLLRAPASPFVERFLGNDRALKRLSRLTIADLADGALDPPIPSTNGSALAAGVSLRDALDALLGSEEGQLGVLGDDGRVRGTVTVEVIGERLR